MLAHPHWRREQRGPPSRSLTKSHSSPPQPTADATPARRCARSPAARFHFLLRELLLLTRPNLAQPLLSTADPAGNGVFLSPLGVTVAVPQPCSSMRDVSKYRVRLAPGSIPAHADPVTTTSTAAWQTKLFRCAFPTPPRLAACLLHLQSKPLTDRLFSFVWGCAAASCHCLGRCCAAAGLDCAGAAGAARKADIEYVILAGSSLFLCKSCTFV